MTLYRPIVAGLALGLAAWLPAAPALAAGLLKPVGAPFGPLELDHHEVRVVINNGFARTEVDQVFKNPHGADLEAKYAFPLPRRASLSELSLWVDGKELTGEVLPKEEAKDAYEEEKAAGNDAGLAEKDSYRSFEVSVSPVRAGGSTRVRLVYYQPLEIDTGIGRYVYPLEEGGVDEAKEQAFLLNDVVTGEATFKLDLRLKTAYPVEAVLVPSHPEASVLRDADGYHVQVSSPGPATLRRDFVLNYRLADRPASVELIPYRTQGAAEGTFMAVVTPGDDLRRIGEGSDWTFVLDVSGSMQAKLAFVAEGVKKALGRLRPEDRFRVALFDDTARWLVEPFTPASGESVEQAIAQVQALRPGGGTNLYGGLVLGLSELDPGRTSAVLVVTDGVANVGPTGNKAFLDLMKGADVRLFTFVMGNSADTPLLEDLALASNGFAMSLSNDDAIVGRLLQASSKLTHEALHGVRLQLEGLTVSDLAPSEPLTLYRGDQLVVFGKYRGAGQGTLELSGKVSGRPLRVKLPVTLPAHDVRNPEVERLWALAKIEELERRMRLGGDARELETAVRDLGVRYSLVTDRTSMVVMTDDRFAARRIERRNLDRVLRERTAQRARVMAPAPSYQAAYSPGAISRSSQSRLSRGGGGSVGPLFSLLAAGMAMIPALRRRRTR